MKWSIKSEKISQSISWFHLFWMCPKTYRVSLFLLGPATLHMATLCLKKTLLYIIWSILSAVLAGWKDSNMYSALNNSSFCPFAPPCCWSTQLSLTRRPECCLCLTSRKLSYSCFWVRKLLMAACCGLDVVSPSLSLCWRLGPQRGASEGWRGTFHRWGLLGRVGVVGVELGDWRQGLWKEVMSGFCSESLLWSINLISPIYICPPRRDPPCYDTGEEGS